MKHLVNTVNVIEWISDTIQSIRSFTDTPEGREEAEALFAECAKENGFTDSDVEYGLEEGVLERDGGEYRLFIAHGG